MTLAIEVRQVHKRFGALHALGNIDLEINTGEFFALLGPNGAGKTTLINIIAGLTLASSGSVRIMGYDVVANYREARRTLGVVPQELVFDPFFTVRETLVIQSGYYGLKKNSAWIDEIIHHLDLADKADVNMRSLSGGMKRRAGGAGIGAQTPGNRSGRTHGGGGCGITPGTLAFHQTIKP